MFKLLDDMIQLTCFQIPLLSRPLDVGFRIETVPSGMMAISLSNEKNDNKLVSVQFGSLRIVSNAQACWTLKANWSLLKDFLEV
jgi:hypothetical protein